MRSVSSKKCTCGKFGIYCFEKECRDIDTINTELMEDSFKQEELEQRFPNFVEKMSDNFVKKPMHDPDALIPIPWVNNEPTIEEYFDSKWKTIEEEFESKFFYADDNISYRFVDKILEFFKSRTTPI